MDNYNLLVLCIVFLISHEACDRNNQLEMNKSIQNKYEGREILLKVNNYFYSRYNFHSYGAHIKRNDFSHSILAFMVGDSIKDYDSWKFWDPMNNILYKEDNFIVNSTVSITVSVFGHIEGQNNVVVDSYPICNLEIVRFKFDSNGKASLDYYNHDIDLNPKRKTILKYIQDKYGFKYIEMKTSNKIPILVGQEYSDLFYNIGVEHYNRKNYTLALECLWSSIFTKPNDESQKLLKIIRDENDNIRSLYKKIFNGAFIPHLGKIE